MEGHKIHPHMTLAYPIDPELKLIVAKNYARSEYIIANRYHYHYIL